MMDKDSLQDLFDIINKYPLQLGSILISQETKDDMIDWNELGNEWGKGHLEGPTTKMVGNRQCWYLDGKRHREDGPAIAMVVDFGI